MKVLVPYGCPAEGFAPLIDAGHQVMIPPLGERFSKEELAALLPETEGLVADSAVDADMIAQAPKLQIICAYGAGYDNVNVAEATKRGVMVCNVPHAVTASTAEITFGLMLDVMRKITYMDKRLHSENPAPLFRMGLNMGTSLEGCKLGIIGLGRIGKKVADIGKAFGMEIYYYSRTRKPEREQLGDSYLPLQELLRTCDVVSLHCPSTPLTRGLISKEELSIMKPTAFLINTARGDVVDDAALIEALWEHRIAGAGLDVFKGEPNMNPDYLTLDNVVLVPHIGCNTNQTRLQTALAVSQTILDVFQKKNPKGLINPECLHGLQ